MPSRSMNTLMVLVGGTAAGVAGMYLLDPSAGRRRRTAIANAANYAVHHAGDAVHHAGDAIHDAAISAGEKIGDLAARARRAGEQASHAAGQLATAASAVAAAPSAAHVGRTSAATAAGLRRLVNSYHDSAHYLADRVDHLRAALDPHAGSHAASLAHAGHAILDPVVNRAKLILGHVHFPRSTVAKGSMLLVPITAGGVICLAAGAGAMYFLDPDRGRARRTGLREGMFEKVRHIGRMARRRGKNVRGNFEGLARQVGLTPQRRVSSRDYVSGEQLLLRVRSEIARTAGNPRAIQVMTEASGTVTLTGEIVDSEHDRVTNAVRQTPGVRQLVDRLDVRATPGATQTAVQGT